MTKGPYSTRIVARLMLLIGISFLFTNCKKDESTSVAAQPSSPIVKIVSPSNNAHIPDSTIIEIEATDDKGVVKVEVFIDNVLTRTFIIPPFRFTWSVRALSDSTYHIIYAKAYDGDGNVSSTNVVTVQVVRLGSPSNIVFPTSNVSYSQHVQPLFNQACALAGCHDDGVSGLKLTSYGNAVLTYPGVVIMGQPDQSTLVLRIQGTVGQRMPLDRSLNQNQISGIRTWIAEGARNN